MGRRNTMKRKMQPSGQGTPCEPPAGVLFVVNKDDEHLYMQRMIFGHHLNLADFVHSVVPRTLCFMYRMHKQDLVGIMEVTMVGINLDHTLYFSERMNGSMYPAQIAVQPWWECSTTLQGERLFNIIGGNLGLRGGLPKNLSIQRRAVEHRLDRAQVDALVAEFRIQEGVFCSPFQLDPFITPTTDAYDSQQRPHAGEGGRPGSARGRHPSPTRPPPGGPRASGPPKDARVKASFPREAPSTQKTQGKKSTHHNKTPSEPGSSGSKKQPVHGTPNSSLSTLSRTSRESEPPSRLTHAPLSEGRWGTGPSPGVPNTLPSLDILPESSSASAPIVQDQPRETALVPANLLVPSGVPTAGELVQPGNIPQDTLAAAPAAAPPVQPTEPVRRIVRRAEKVQSLLWRARGRREEHSEVDLIHRIELEDDTIEESQAMMYGGDMMGVLRESVLEVGHPLHPATVSRNGMTEDEVRDLNDDDFEIEVTLGPVETFESALHKLLDVLPDCPYPASAGNGMAPPVPPQPSGPLPRARQELVDQPASSPEVNRGANAAAPSLQPPAEARPSAAETPAKAPAVAPPGPADMAKSAPGRREQQQGPTAPHGSAADHASAPEATTWGQPAPAQAPTKKAPVGDSGKGFEFSTVQVTNLPTVKGRVGPAMEEVAQFLKARGYLDVLDFIYLYDCLQKPPNAQGQLIVHAREKKDGAKLHKQLQRWRPSSARGAIRVVFQQGENLDTMLRKYGHRTVRLGGPPSAYVYAGMGFPNPLAFFQAIEDPERVVSQAGILLRNAPRPPLQPSFAAPHSAWQQGPPDWINAPMHMQSSTASCREGPPRDAPSESHPPSKLPSAGGRGTKRPRDDAPLWVAGPGRGSEDVGKKARRDVGWTDPQGPHLSKDGDPGGASVGIQASLRVAKPAVRESGGRSPLLASPGPALHSGGRDAEDGEISDCPALTGGAGNLSNVNLRGQDSAKTGRESKDVAGTGKDGRDATRVGLAAPLPVFDDGRCLGTERVSVKAEEAGLPTGMCAEPGLPTPNCQDAQGLAPSGSIAESAGPGECRNPEQASQKAKRVGSPPENGPPEKRQKAADESDRSPPNSGAGKGPDASDVGPERLTEAGAAESVAVPAAAEVASDALQGHDGLTAAGLASTVVPPRQDVRPSNPLLRRDSTGSGSLGDFISLNGL
eukprot:jgi/Botrbrau1/21826/Bobra.0190s0041.1